MKIDYDAEADVLYVTFGSGKPSYSEEVDNILILDRDIEGDEITGYRILDFGKIYLEECGAKFLENLLGKVKLDLSDEEKMTNTPGIKEKITLRFLQLPDSEFVTLLTAFKSGVKVMEEEWQRRCNKTLGV